MKQKRLMITFFLFCMMIPAINAPTTGGMLNFFDTRLKDLVIARMIAISSKNLYSSIVLPPLVRIVSYLFFLVNS